MMKQPRNMYESLYVAADRQYYTSSWGTRMWRFFHPHKAIVILKGHTKMPPVTVYSKPSCPQCTMTKVALGKADIKYNEIDIIENPDALAYVLGLGYLQAPVVVVGEDHWSGFRPDRIKAIA